MSLDVDYLKEVLEPFGPVQARRMFGGLGLYHAGLMFALVADDVLYLKADEASARYFEALDLPRFSYEKRGKTVSLSYFMAPAEMFDDPDAARTWAARAYEAALRQQR